MSWKTVLKFHLIYCPKPVWLLNASVDNHVIKTEGVGRGSKSFFVLSIAWSVCLKIKIKKFATDKADAYFCIYTLKIFDSRNMEWK